MAIGGAPATTDYWINEWLCKPLAGYKPLLAKCILGMVKYAAIDDQYELLLVSRTDNHRLGRRWQCRGADTEGHSANTVETEQIIVKTSTSVTEVAAYVHLRGSVPFGWSSFPDMRWPPQQKL